MASAGPTRRMFLGTSAAFAVASPVTSAPGAARYKRSLVTSPEGKKALASYAKGVEAMLKLPADNPHNWFRNAFVHLMDCPHGNWWFYVWHRGYLGYFEETIRSLSGDQDFALPYWDWTALPQIPDGMFDGALTPTSDAFKPYTQTLEIFSSFFKPAFEKYWDGLSPRQKRQLDTRGYKSIDDVWNDVTGNGNVGNESFAVTSGARYLSSANAKLDKDTSYAVSKNTVLAGLLAPKFYDATGSLSFTSSKTSSHNSAPNGKTVFSVLEGQPHNLVHNCIGGVGAIDPGPYGNMTNFLSPVDPVFFLHHANMDRLWDVWSRKQKSLKQPYLPEGSDRKALSDEPFLFFVDGKGQPVLNGKASDYLSTDRFGYEYDRAGFGEDLIGSPTTKLVAQAAPSVAAARITGNTASVDLPAASRPQQGAAAETPRPLVAQITVARPSADSGVRQFRVFAGAPSESANLGTDSPSYVGTIGFFGPQMAGMHMSSEATFSIPVPAQHSTLATPAPTATRATVSVQVVPVGGGKAPGPVLKAVSFSRL
jgi:tyrosinase